MKKMRFTLILLIASFTAQLFAEQLAVESIVTAPNSEDISPEAGAEPIDLSADVIIDGPRSGEDASNDYLSRVIMASAGADMAIWRIGSTGRGQAFFGSPEHAVEEGIGNAAGLIPIGYIALASGQVGSQICVNGEPKTYLFNEDTHDERTPIGLGESYVFKTRVLDENLFPKSDHLDRPYLAQDFAARSVQLLSLDPVEEMLADPVKREQLVDLVILNVIADAQLAVYAGHNKWLKYTIEILNTACESDDVLRQEYDRLLDDPRRVSDSLSQNSRIVEANAERSAPAVFEFAEKTQDVVNREMFQELNMGDEVVMANFVLSPNRAIVFPNIETAVEYGGTRGRLDELNYLVFEGRELSDSEDNGNLLCGDKVFMLREDTYGGQRGLGLSYVMEKQWLDEFYYPIPVPDRDQFFFTVDFHKHALSYLNPEVGPFPTSGFQDKQRDLVILSALADLQKGLFESNRSLVDESKRVLATACSEPGMVVGKATELYEDEDKVTRIRAALMSQLESYEDNEFVFANFASVVEEEARLATHNAVMGTAYDLVEKSYFATGNGLLIFTSLEAGEGGGLNPFTAQEARFTVFYGREMLSADPQEVIAAAGSRICSDKVYMLDENAHLEDTPFLSSQIMERDWLNPDYFPKSVAGREGSFFRFDFESNMLDHYDALFAEDVTPDVIEKQQDLVILAALYDLQRAAFQGNQNAMDTAVRVMQNVCDDDQMRVDQVAKLKQDRARVLIPRDTTLEAHERFEGLGYTPVEFSNRMDVDDVNQRMFVAIEGDELARRSAQIFGTDIKGVTAGVELPEVRTTRYYPTPGGSSVFPDITSAARAIQSSPLGIDPTDYLVFFGRGIEGGSEAEQAAAQASLICSDKVYLVEEDGVFEDVSLERLMIMKRSWLDDAYFPEQVGDRQGRFVAMDFMVHALKYLELGALESMDDEAKERLIDLAIINSLYDMQEAIYKKDSEAFQQAAVVLDQVCSNEAVLAEQYNVLKAERIKVLGAIQTANRIIERFANSEFTPFEFSQIDELKSLGALGVPVAARWASVYGNSVVTTHFIQANPETEMVYSDGQAPEGEEVIQFPMLVLDGSAGEDSICSYNYSFMVIPGIGLGPDNAPQPLYVLGIKKTSELDFEASSFEEMLGVEPGEGISFADLQARADEFTTLVFEARDKGLLGFEDEDKNDQLMSSITMNMLINYYAQAGAIISRGDPSEEVISEVRRALTSACDPERKDPVLYTLMGTLPPETPERFLQEYQDSLTGEEIAVGAQGWEPPEGSPLREALSEGGGAGPGTAPASPEEQAAREAAIEEALQETVDSFADYFKNSTVSSFRTYVDPSNGTFYDEGAVPEGVSVNKLPVMVIDDSKGEGEICSYGAVYVLLPGVSAPQFFMLAVLPRDEANLSATTLAGVLGLPDGEGITVEHFNDMKLKYQALGMEARDKGILRFEDQDKQNKLNTYFTMYSIITAYGSNLESILQNRGLTEGVFETFKQSLNSTCNDDYDTLAYERLATTQQTTEEVRATYADELTGDEVPIGGSAEPAAEVPEGPQFEDPYMQNYAGLLGRSVYGSFPVKLTPDFKVYFDNEAPEGVESQQAEVMVLFDSDAESVLCKSDYLYGILPSMAPQQLVLLAKPLSEVDFSTTNVVQFLGLEGPEVDARQLMVQTQSLMEYLFEARDKGVFEFEELEKNQKLNAAITISVMRSMHASMYQLLQNPVPPQAAAFYRNEMQKVCGEGRQELMGQLFATLPQTPGFILQKYRSELPADWQPIGEPLPQRGQ